MTPIQRLLEKLPRAKKCGDGWSARCPAHDDSRPSLSVAEGDDGRALVNCHAGCTFEAIVSALGLTARDLMPEGDGRYPHRVGKAAPRVRTFPTSKEALQELERRHGERSTYWTYHDAAATQVGLVVRWDRPEGKDIRPIARHGDRWRIGAMREPRPLYALHELVKAMRVVVAEGEKSADAARSLGFTATTSAGGSNAAHKTDWRPLAGKEVLLLPDNDPPGRQYIDTVAQILAKLTPAPVVRVVNLPGLPEGGDIVDWVEAHGDAAEADALRAEIESLAARVTVGNGPILICMADVEPETVPWLWPNRIPLGRITLIVGRPGEGKSFFTAALAAHVSTGRDFPDGSACLSGSVIIISAEDHPANTIRPRLDANEADVNRVFILPGVMLTTADGKRTERAFTLADVPSLETALEKHPDCKLVVIDPIGSYLGGGTDAHRDNAVRDVLTPVVELASRRNVAVVMVAHRRKSSADFADDGVLGSRAFTGIARAVWHLSSDPSDKARRLLLPGKNNLTQQGNGLAFRIEGNPGRIVWEGDAVEMSADDAQLAEARAAADQRKPGPVAKPRKDAARWLQDALAGGPLPPAELKRLAADAGHSWRTVERAADDLAIIRDRRGFGEGTRWQLLGSSDVESDDRSRHDTPGRSCQETATDGHLAIWRECKTTGEITSSDVPKPDPAKLQESGAIEKKPKTNQRLSAPRRFRAEGTNGDGDTANERPARNGRGLFDESPALPD